MVYIQYKSQDLSIMFPQNFSLSVLGLHPVLQHTNCLTGTSVIGYDYSGSMPCKEHVICGNRVYIWTELDILGSIIPSNVSTQDIT